MPESKRLRLQKAPFPPEVLDEIFSACESVADWRSIRQISPRFKRIVDRAIIIEVRLGFGPEHWALQLDYFIRHEHFAKKTLFVPDDKFASTWNAMKTRFISPHRCQHLVVELSTYDEDQCLSALRLVNEAGERFFRKMDKLEITVGKVDDAALASKEVTFELFRLVSRTINRNLKGCLLATIEEDVAKQILMKMINAQVARIEFRATAEVARFALKLMEGNSVTNLTLHVPASEGNSELVKRGISELCESWSATPKMHRNIISIEGASAAFAMSVPFQSMTYVQMVAEHQHAHRHDAITIKFSLLPQLVRVSHSRVYQLKITAQSRIGLLLQGRLSPLVLELNDVHFIDSFDANGEHCTQCTLCPLPDVDDTRTFMIFAAWCFQGALFQTSNIHKFADVDQFSVEGLPAEFQLC